MQLKFKTFTEFEELQKFVDDLYLAPLGVANVFFRGDKWYLVYWEDAKIANLRKKREKKKDITMEQAKMWGATRDFCQELKENELHF